jgi:hypothetical protein
VGIYHIWNLGIIGGVRELFSYRGRITAQEFGKSSRKVGVILVQRSYKDSGIREEFKEGRDLTRSPLQNNNNLSCFNSTVAECAF